MKSYKLADYAPYVNFYDGRTDQIGAITAFIQSIADQGISFHGIVA